MNETHGNNLAQMVTQAIDEMKAELGDCFDIEKINLAELQRTGISRSKLRRLKRNGWKDLPHGNSGTHKKRNVLSEYTGTADDLLRSNVTNSEVIYDKLVKLGYKGGRTNIKNYIAANRAPVHASRYAISLQEKEAGCGFFSFILCYYGMPEYLPHRSQLPVLSPEPEQLCNCLPHHTSNQSQ